MSIETLISNYGYLAVALGTLVEGEIVLALGGFAAQRGYLLLPGIILAAFVGALLGDQVFFHLGRLKGHRLLDRRRTWQQRAESVLVHVHRHQVLLILGYRWLYGLRMITPFVIGMSGVAPWKFLLFDAISVAAWATGVGIFGYFFGSVVEAALGDIRNIEIWTIFGIVTLGLIVLGIRRWRMWAASRDSDGNTEKRNNSN